MTCTCLVLQWIHAQASVHGGVDFTRFSHVKVDLGSRVHTWKSGHYFHGSVYLVFICQYGGSCRPLGAQLQGFGRLLFLALGQEGHPDGTLLGTLLHVAWSRLFTFLLRWLAVPGFR